jgi:serine/threonine protein kinase
MAHQRLFSSLDTHCYFVHIYRPIQYLSPERARGLDHDTRKSDVWSLGITFFEILIGRTPFEYVEGEQFSTKEDLEKYWARTVCIRVLPDYPLISCFVVS